MKDKFIAIKIYITGVLKSTWVWVDQTILTKSVAGKMWAFMDMIKASSVWGLIFLCILGSISMVWLSIQSMINADVVNSLSAALVAIMLLLITLLADRYMRGPAPTGGGKNR